MRKTGEKTFIVMKQKKHFCKRGKHTFLSVKGKEAGDTEEEREFKGLGLQL